MMERRTLSPAERSLWGQYGEEIAAHWLQRQGYDIIAHNFTCKQGEIDIVCQGQDEDGADLLVFVEVRSIHGIDPADAIASIDHKKRQRMISAARYYLSQSQLNEEPAIGLLCIGIAHQTDESIRMQQQWMEWF